MEEITKDVAGRCGGEGRVSEKTVEWLVKSWTAVGSTIIKQVRCLPLALGTAERLFIFLALDTANTLTFSPSPPPGLGDKYGCVLLYFSHPESAKWITEEMQSLWQEAACSVSEIRAHTAFSEDLSDQETQGHFEGCPRAALAGSGLGMGKVSDSL